jgi:hypothetical protein
VTAPTPPVGPFTDRALVAWLLDEPPCDPDWDVRPVTDLPDISNWQEQP